MIFGNIKHLNDYPFLDEAVKECFAYAQNNDLLSFEKGSHPIDGERLYVNIAEYETTVPENRFWEAHKQYLDLHLILRGEERIDLAFIENAELKEYVEKDDFLPLDAAPIASAALHENDFLICYPQDGHMTGLAVNEPLAIKKAIFKIRIS